MKTSQREKLAQEYWQECRRRVAWARGTEAVDGAAVAFQCLGRAVEGASKAVRRFRGAAGSAGEAL